MSKNRNSYLFGNEEQETTWKPLRGVVKKCANKKCPLKGKYLDRIHDHAPIPYSDKQISELVRLHGEEMAVEFVTHFKEKEELRVARANNYCQACR